tara:strand:- start:841 stop:1107 length:267 start_codon:yes stop_codon:yes gene_type:complete
MKRLFYLLFVCYVALVGCNNDSKDKEDINDEKNNSSQYTDVTQNYEKALIIWGYDDVMDGKVLTKNIDSLKTVMMKAQMNRIKNQLLE